MDNVTCRRINRLMKNWFNGGKNGWISEFICEWITGWMN